MHGKASDALQADLCGALLLVTPMGNTSFLGIPMVTAGALAIIGGLATDLTATLVGYGLVLSFAALPLMYRLIQRVL